MSLRKDEKSAAEALGQLLSKLAIPHTWKPGDDPPDLEFQVKGEQRWAVEETGFHQYFKWHRDVESRAAIVNPLWRMCENISERVSNILNKKYTIVAMGPSQSPSLAEIENRAVQHIQNGRTDKEVLDDHGRVFISCKTSPVQVGWRVGLSSSVQSANGKSIASDIRASLEYGLARILQAKLPRLAQCQDYTHRILIITKKYFFAEPFELKEILEGCSLSSKQVDSILLLDAGELYFVADPGHLLG
jgi:hypothetical protein